MNIEQTPEAITEATKQLCVEFIEAFATEYVEKWVGIQGDGAKAHGWAILQAAQALRRSGF